MSDALFGAPWWVYVLFFVLLATGLQARKPSTVSLVRLFIIPVLFTIWSLLSMQKTADRIAIWAVALAIGALIGYFMYGKFKLRADKKKHLVTTPGGWTTLILVMVIFFVKYFLGYSYAIDPSAVHNPAYFVPDLLISGLVTGMFVGRLITTLVQYSRASHSDL